MTSVSFRDPAGKVFFHQGQLFRAINKTGEEDFQRALNSPILEKFVKTDHLVKVFELEISEKAALLNEIESKHYLIKETFSRLVKHEVIPFRSYPYEWTPEMLHSAALLTLKLAQKLLNEGIGLKDATPYNVLFRGANPVFVDWLSFEKRDGFDPIWLSQSQFIRTFCLPLMTNKYFGLELGWIFRVNRDGLEPEQVYKMCGSFQKILPPFLSFVTIPKLLNSKSQKTSSIYQKQTFDNSEKAKFVLNRQFNSLEKLLKKIKPSTDKKSEWSEYIGDNQHFTDAYLQQKHNFVKTALEELKPARVLDIGCNTGFFSRVAAQAGSSVVSIDRDATVVSKVWQMAEKDSLDILPLVVDISRPSPAIGWANDECPSFLERAKGKMDAIMMLAVIHHILVSERVPLDKIIDLAAQLTNDVAIIEFVPPDDPMFRQIARGRDYLFEDLNEQVFREVCSKYFKILRYEKLADSNRQLYLLQK